MKWRVAIIGAGVEEKVQNALQNCSGGNFENSIHKEFSDINLYHTILTINVLAGKIVKFPYTTALKGTLKFFFDVWSGTTTAFS